jgi:sorbitol-specific phosphotransferase system component IIBC
MQPTVRSALVLLAGVVVAVIVVTLGDTVAGSIYSLPAGVDRSNPESMRQAVAGLPTAAFLLLLAGWVLAAAVGSYIAARLATQARAIHGLIVAVFVLVATVANLAAIPHPAWLWPAVIILIPAAGWLATRLVVRSPAATTSP